MISEARAREIVAARFGVQESDVNLRVAGDLYIGRLALADRLDGRMLGASVYVVDSATGDVSSYPSLSDELVLNLHASKGH